MDPFDSTKFEVGICQFLLFRSEEGTEAKPNPHSDCPGEKSLAGWTKKQHADHGKFKKGSPTDMTCERKKILAQAGFPFKLSNDERWDLCAKELSSFNDKNGHSRVPRHYEVKGIKLGDWVHNQGKAWKAHSNGGTSSLTTKRIVKLNSIEFEWMVYNWDEMFKQLQLYKNEHGSSYVPRKYEANLSLGRWVATQRAQYKAKETGGESSITGKQISMLDSIGFLWAIY